VRKHTEGEGEAQIHIYSLTTKHTYIHVRKHTYMHVHKHTYMRVRKHTYMHVRKHTLSNMRMHTHKRALEWRGGTSVYYQNTYLCVYTLTNIHVHIYM